VTRLNNPGSGTSRKEAIYTSTSEILSISALSRKSGTTKPRPVYSSSPVARIAQLLFRRQATKCRTRSRYGAGPEIAVYANTFPGIDDGDGTRRFGLVVTVAGRDPGPKPRRSFIRNSTQARAWRLVTDHRNIRVQETRTVSISCGRTGHKPAHHIHAHTVPATGQPYVAAALSSISKQWPCHSWQKTSSCWFGPAFKRRAGGDAPGEGRTVCHQRPLMPLTRKTVGRSKLRLGALGVHHCGAAVLPWQARHAR
jgi:hypothetical protein